MADPEERVNVISSITGEMVNVPASQVAEAQAQGYRIASSEAIQAAREGEEFGGYGGMIGATLAGGLRGMTLGGSDVLAEAVGLDDELAALQRANPGLSMAGEVAGSVVGLGKAKAATTGGKIVRGLAAPNRLATRAGMAVERGLGSGVLGSVAGAAVEGTIAGAGAGVSQLALGDDPLTGETVAAALGHNALMGGALGAGVAGGLGGLGLVGRKVGGALSSPSREAIAEGIEAVTGAPAPQGLIDHIAAAVDGTSAAVGGRRPGVLTEYVSKGKSGRRLHETAAQADELIARHGEELYQHAEKMQRAREMLHEDFTGAMKEAQVRKRVSRGNEAATANASRVELDRMRQRLTDMIDDRANFGKRGSLKDMRARVEDVHGRIDEIITGPDGKARMMMEIDSLKRDAQEYAAKTSKGRLKKDTDTHFALVEESESLRQMLEREDLWGDAGTMQRRMNEAWTKDIQSTSGWYGHKPGQGFATRVAEDFGRRGPKAELNREAFDSFLRSLKNPETDQAYKAMSGFIDNTEARLVAARELLDLPPEKMALLDELLENPAKMRESLEAGKEIATARNLERELSATGGVAGAMGGGIVGGAILGGPVGAIAGTVLAGLANPAGALRRAAAISHLAKGVKDRMARAIDRGLGRQIKRGAARTVTRAAPGVSRAMDRRREVESRMASARRLSSSHNARQHIGSQFGDATGVAPQTHASAVDTVQRANQYLLDRIPAVGVVPVGPQPMLSDAEVDRMHDIMGAVDDPIGVLEAVTQGRADPEAIGAVRAVYPALFADMQSRTMEALVDAEAAGALIPFPARIAMGVMLDIPTHPLLQPEAVQMLQQGYAPVQPDTMGPSPGGPQGGSKPPQLSGAFRAGSEKTTEETE